MSCKAFLTQFLKTLGTLIAIEVTQQHIFQLICSLFRTEGND